MSQCSFDALHPNITDMKLPELNQNCLVRHLTRTFYMEYLSSKIACRAFTYQVNSCNSIRVKSSSNKLRCRLLYRLRCYMFTNGTKFTNLQQLWYKPCLQSFYSLQSNTKKYETARQVIIEDTSFVSQLLSKNERNYHWAYLISSGTFDNPN